jgi:hypothetical protein
MTTSPCGGRGPNGPKLSLSGRQQTLRHFLGRGMD